MQRCIEQLSVALDQFLNRFLSSTLIPRIFSVGNKTLSYGTIGDFSLKKDTLFCLFITTHVPAKIARILCLRNRNAKLLASLICTRIPNDPGM